VADDPERQRVADLLDRVKQGAVSEAEREELALYVAGDPRLVETIQRREEEARLGGEWLARATADDRIALVESSTRSKLERGLGLTLTLGGMLVVFGAPTVGSVACLLGLLLLAYSLIRVRLQSHPDPYKDIRR